MDREELQVLTLVSNRLGKSHGVPRGLLKLLVLTMLSEKPMSGTEIAHQIEKQTGGRWKPSSGSIYPLLAWMRDKGFTIESPKVEEGNKRYNFTAKGSEFLKKQIELGQDFLNKLEFLLPMLIEGLQLGCNKEKLRGTIEPAKRLTNAFVTIRHNLYKLAPEDESKITQTLNDCALKLETIALKLANEKNTNFD